jgi:hypothetical protein
MMTMMMTTNDNPSAYPLVWIEFDDHASVDAWTHSDDMQHGAAKCIAVGWLMRETERELYVSTTRSDQSGCCTMIILKPLITRREPLQLPFFVALNARLEELRQG